MCDGVKLVCFIPLRFSTVFNARFILDVKIYARKVERDLFKLLKIQDIYLGLPLSKTS